MKYNFFILLIKIASKLLTVLKRFYFNQNYEDDILLYLFKNTTEFNFFSKHLKAKISLFTRTLQAEYRFR